LFDTPVLPVKTAVGEGQKEFERGTEVEAAAEAHNPIEADKPGKADVATPMEAEAGPAGANVEGGAPAAGSEEWEACKNMTFYEFFLRRMQTLTEKEAKTADQLLKELDISKTQLNAWLKQATQEGKLKKKKAPVRYAWVASEPTHKQALIF
jgi:hypothetical protein